MKLKSLQLVNFRNYEKLHLEFNGKVNLLVGKNGQGKTNIVESIYMLSFGKSFRTNKDREMVRFNSENLYVGGSFSKYNKYSLIELIIGKDKKGIRINKVPLQKMQELLGNLNVVIFSPEDLRLVKEGPKERRTFIDKEISQIIPKYYNYLTNYNKILSQRSRVLKSIHVDEALLDVYDDTLAKYGSYIYILRRDFIKKIANISEHMHMNLTNGIEKLSIKYKTQINITDEDTIETVYNKFLAKLSSNRPNDIESRTTRYGIHKDDLNIFINDLDARLFGSQGQQRTASISLKLSEIELIKNEVEEYPVLILDDVFSELDEARQKLLVNNLSNVQMFITSAEISHKKIFDEKDVTIFNIENGNVISIENGGN
ncbi:MULTISPECIES: DNA replication/repair protein RecF [unclassified Clostridioides]|uniref:DNA replication/repair protein RecF n=1 Tax=unclassified Clostridioides TaxID=2635829 RepID=UPI001D101230|nr:DNA replication/repair protein RecF [Clostridioides sp. ZZV15-6388]MCC0645823.1 DNA replication/repair protein RecF [Clostridioides sp. ZZV14-6150]MCC0662136.1 DNA replication/repair protein RecF [Clostridioides sp. ZZV14-6154]MCC0663111.1 DNA replication/repair protein RecF [Clostridioides sp. ZZV15-6597]MCC0669924.1 DNA replication/repair protein RecF [Clostridioides sp. ZZV14-6153]MCC0719928.1 DNA replication/repair protein RecF [Clostridioides sp. ZZV14-6105]MCC0724082.1 DNA replicatio